jgi:filamentous hemagglutinin family protein
LLIAAALSLSASIVEAAPLGGQVVTGAGTITQAGTTTTVTQASQNLLLNWKSFNIAPQETVDFVQPSATSIAVNRIFDINGTQILGHLNANGQVYLINPNGIVFGRGSQVDVGGLVASTLDLSGPTFGTDTKSFSGSGSGSIVNNGTITASGGGYVALLANTVSNSGAISAQLGSVALGAGSAATLTFAGSHLVHMQVDQGMLNALAENSGVIRADGGQVLMTAGAKDTLLASVVNNTGVIEANTVENRGGSIALMGGATAGSVVVKGTLDVSSATAQGGEIVVTGDSVTVGGGARVEATGATGGGSIAIGGGWEGRGNIPESTTVYVSNTATLDASATRQGDGGKVVVWADGTANFAGSIVAKGAGQDGAGGSAEVSGKTLLNDSGLVDLVGSQGGQTGTLLLDPYNLYITSGTGGSATASGNNSILGVSTLTSQLGTASVVVSTGSGGTQSGTIGVMTDITSGSTNNLTLTAANNVVLDGNVTIGGQLTVNAGGNFVMGTNLSTAAGTTIAANGGFVKTGSGTSYLTGNITTIGTAINIAGPVQVANFNGGANPLTLSTGGGNITLSGAVSNYSGTAQNYAAVMASNLYDGVSASTVAGSSTDVYLSYSAGSNLFLNQLGLPTTLNYLLVGGGGGGGNSLLGSFSGGGGGGGGATSGSYSFSGSPLAITVGAGGALNGNGGDSSFGSIYGGGGGGGGNYNASTGLVGYGNNNPSVAGRTYVAGGGGGGAGSNQGNGTVGGTGTAQTGGTGGASATAGGCCTNNGGAGGGATGNAVFSGGQAMTGGAGYSSTITGTSIAYGSGGNIGGTAAANTGGGGGAQGYGTYSGANGTAIVSYTVGNASTSAASALKLSAGSGSVSLGSSVSNLSSLEINAGAPSSITGAISGTGSTLTNSGAGILSVNGAATYTGLTAVTSSGIVFANNAPPTTSGFTGAGIITIEPSTASSFTSTFTPGYTYASTLTGLTLGSASNTAGVTVGSAINIAGPISLYGGNINLNTNLTSTLAGAAILANASGGITDGGNVSTSGGDITLWANSAGASTGGIQVSNGVTLSSLGGAITLGGSANNAVISGLPATSANGTTLPQGYAENLSGSMSGVSLGTNIGAGGQNSAVTINSGNGRISIAGQSSQYVGNYSFGVLTYEGVNVNAGTGDIVLSGLSTGATANDTDTGFVLAGFFGGRAPSKWQTNGGDITLNGTASGATGYALGADPQEVTIENTGASSGSVTINGSASNGSFVNFGIRTWITNILSKSGAITLNASAAGDPFTQVAGYTTTLGSLAGSDVISSNANINLTADAVSIGGALVVNTTGNLMVQPYSASFSSALTWPLSGLTVASSISGLTLGKPGNTANLTVSSAQTVAGPISLFGGNVTLNAALTASGTNTITLDASGSTTEGASGNVTATNLLLNGSGSYTFGAMTVGTLAATGVTNLSLTNSAALSIGTVGATNGISASGTVAVSTTSGNLTVSQNVATSNGSSSALVLDAGTSDGINTTVDNIVLSDTPTVTVGTNGRAILYTGSVAGSTGVTSLVGSGSGDFRYDSKLGTSNFTSALGSSGTDAVYRAQPTLMITANSPTAITYGSATPSYTTTVAGSNGDTATQALSTQATVTDDGIHSTSGKLIAATHTLTASAAVGQLGYALSYATGSLLVNKLALTGSIGSGSSVYGSALTAGSVSYTNAITNDVLGIAFIAVNTTGNTSTGGKLKAGGYTGIESISALAGADASNYTFAALTGNYTVSKLALTGAAVAAVSTTYGTSAAAGVVTFGNLISSDLVSGTASVTSPLYSTSNNLKAGGYSQTASSTLTGADAGNYTFAGSTTGTTNYTVSKLALTGAAVAAVSTTYGTSAAAGTVTFGNLIPSDVVSGAASVTTPSYSGSGNLNAGSYTQSAANALSGADAGNYTFAGATSASNYTVNPLALAVAGVTANNKVYDGTTAATLSGTASVSALGGDTVTLIGASTAAFADMDVANSKAVTVSGYALSGADAGNYSVVQPSGLSANITPAPLTVSGLTGTARNYNGSSVDTLTGTGALSGLVGSETLTLVNAITGTLASQNAGSEPVTTAITLGNGTGGGLGTNYTLTQPTLANVAIGQAPLTVSGLSGTARNYNGSGVDTLTGTGALSGLVGSETLTLVNVTTGTLASANAGSEPVTTAITLGNGAGGGLGSNYSLTQPSLANVAIGQAPLTVSGLAGTARNYNGSTVDTLTGTGVLSGLVGSETLTLGGTSSGTLASANAGSEPLTTAVTLANGTGGLASNYVLTQPSLANVTIAPAPLTVTGLTGTGRNYDGTTLDALAGTGVLSGLQNGETLTLVNPASGTLASANAGSEPVITAITLMAGTGSTSNYSLTQPTLANVTIGQAPLTVSGLSGTARNYNGSTVDTLTGTGVLSGLIGSETLTLGATSSGTLASANAGSEPLTTAVTLANGTGGLASNYVLTQPTLANVTIGQAPLTVSGLSGTARNYDGTTLDALAGTGVLSGLVGSETLTLGGTSSGTLASANAGSEPLSTAITLGNGTGLASNYTLTQPTLANVAIGQAPLTVSGTVTNNKVYDQTTTATLTSASLIGVFAGDAVTLTQAGNFASKDVGTAITVTAADTLGGAAAANYLLTQPTGLTASITPKGLGLTLSGDPTRVYDGTTTFGFTGYTTSLSGVISGDAVNLGTGSVTGYGDKNVGADKTVTFTGFALSGPNADDYQLVSGAATSTASITPATIGVVTGITANNRVYDGGTGATLYNGSAVFTGEIVGDNLTVAADTGSFASKNVATGAAVSITGITLGGTDALNYTLGNTTARTTANITQLASVVWIGPATGGSWSNPANWAVGAIPDLSNVANVVVPAGDTVTFDSSVAGPVQLSNLSSGGLTIAGGTLDVSTALNLTNYAQSGGTVGGPGSFTVNGAFSQTAGQINMGPGSVTITQSQGNLSFANISAGAINLTSTVGNVTLGTLGATSNLAVTALGGAITQSAGATLAVGGTTALQASDAGVPANIDLTNASNTFGSAVSATGAQISLTDAGPLTLGTVNATGNLTLASNGALNLGSSTVGGNLSTTSGNGDVIQNGPLHIGGTTHIMAGTGSIQLNNPLNVLKGNVTTVGGSVAVAGDQIGVTANPLEANVVSQLESSTLMSGAATQPGGMRLPSQTFNEIPTTGFDAPAANDSSSPMASSDGTLVNVTLNIGANGPALRVVNGGVHLPNNAMSFDE